MRRLTFTCAHCWKRFSSIVILTVSVAVSGDVVCNGLLSPCVNFWTATSRSGHAGVCPTALHFGSVGVCSRTGSDPNRPDKVNQDAFFQLCFVVKGKHADNQPPHRFTLLGVLDGHGLKGHVVADYLAEQLPIWIQRHVQEAVFDNDIPTATTTTELEEQLVALGGLSLDEVTAYNQPRLPQALVRAFHSVQWAAAQDPNIPAGRNGATCVAILLDETQRLVHVATVGDSRAILVSQGSSNDSDTGESITVLATETTIKDDNERARIEQQKGTVRGNNVFYGPQGIAMTRSLGNVVMLRAGVVPTPVVKSFEWPTPNNTNNKSYLVLATDGIWEVLHNQMVAKIVLEATHTNADDDGEGVQPASNALGEQARRKWVGDLPIVDEEKVDDITCIVARIT